MGSEGSTDIEFQCPQCGQRGSVTIAEGQLEFTVACPCGWSRGFAHDGEAQREWDRLHETIQRVLGELRAKNARNPGDGS